MARFLPPAVILSLTLAGCTSSSISLQDEYELTRQQQAGLEFAVLDQYPVDGAPGLGHEVEPYFLFNRPLSNRERHDPGRLTIVDLDGLAQGVDAYDLDFDDAGLRFTPALRRDRDYFMSFHGPADGRSEASEAWFDTAAPAGAAFDMADGLEIVSFGGGAGEAGLLQDAFAQPVRPTWVLQALPAGTSEAGEPMIDLVYAPGRFDASQEFAYYLRRDFGYVGVFRDVVLDDDGWFQQTQPGLFLPIWAGDQVVMLYLQDVVVTGWYTRGANGPVTIDRIGIAGVVSTRWLLRTAEQGGLWRTIVESLEPDVDTNGNGVPDSACIMLRMEPTPIDLQEIDL